jgi:hypothetical protein
MLPLSRKCAALSEFGKNEKKRSELKTGKPTGSHALNYRYGMLGGITVANRRDTSQKAR